MSRKSEPEREERRRRLNEQAREARAFMQAVIERTEARQQAEAERLERRRRLVRRVLTLGLG